MTTKNASAIPHPKVSVIVCAYNAQAFIAETLRSLIDQSYPNVEIVVVDDGSRDGTADIVRSLSPRVHYIYQPNAGPGAARNKGIQNSSGEFICFFDSDDLMPTDRLAWQVCYLQGHTDAHIAFCDYRNFSLEGNSRTTHFQTCPELQLHLKGQKEFLLEDACKILAIENFGITGTMMVRRKILEKVPGFSTRLRIGEDLLFYFLVSRHSKVGIINKVGMLRRIHPNNITRDNRRLLHDNIKCYTYLRDTEINTLTRKLLNARIASCWSALARSEANQNQTMSAISYQIKALFIAPCPKEIKCTIYGLCRTMAIATGFHVPDEN